MAQTKIKTEMIDQSGATTDQVLTFNGTDWEPATSGSGVTDHTLLSNIGTNTHTQIDSHISNTSNPHSVDKTDVGLGNVQNTDLTSAVSANTAKVSFDSTSSIRLANTSGTNTGDQDLSGYQPLSSILTNTTASFTDSIEEDIDSNTLKVSFDSTSSTKLGTIAQGAEVNVQSDWDATSGDALILNKPTIPSAGTTIEISSTEPSSPSTDDLWIDTSA